MKNLLTGLVIGALSSSAFATTWTVDDGGKADFDNIQAAVDAASSGDEILVMPGTYTSTQDGHVVNMLGKAVTLRSSDPSNPDVVAATIIDGEGARRGIACFNFETNKTLIEGLTITNGFAVWFDYDGDGDIGWLEDDCGGGMYNLFSSPTVTNCTFTNNTGYSYGGGMSNIFSSPTLIDCTFTGNTANKGGGMYNYDSSPTLTDCTFIDNTANKGGGMGNGYSNPTLINCIFTANTAESDGGGMWNDNSSPTLTDCIFENNTATWGGGMYNHDNSGSNPTLTNTIVCGNTPDQIYGGWTDNGGNTVADECPPDDDDGDGVPDDIDNCYLYNPDQLDCNGNEIGDVCDIADGTSHDLNLNGIPDECEDSDGDGIPDNMDAFPNDPNEWADSDGDGMGDNEDHAALGVCCVNSGCDQLAEVTCSSLGGTWAETGSCDDCVAPPETCAADLNDNGEVDIDDLLLLIAAWGSCP